MYWIDSHCDVLYQLWKRDRDDSFSNKRKNINLFLIDDSPLDVTYDALKQNNVLLQNFAIFVPDNIPQTAKLDVALKQIDLFYQQVEPYVPLVRKHIEFESISDGHILSLLTLEGGDSIGRDISLLRTFYRLGVRQVGLTWNGVNALADGCKEKRNGGLTEFGRKCIKEMVRLGMIIDVSHLSEQGFWDAVSIPGVKVIASHSNSKKHCMHPRNLTDEQIQAIISINGLIGVTYVPQFVFQPYQEARMEHLLHHLNHIRYLGGENHIAFGSDFDGMENKLEGLSNAFEIANFYKLLRSYYPKEIVDKWTYRNAYHFYKNSLS